MPGSVNEWLGLTKAFADQWGFTIVIFAMVALRLGMWVYERLFNKD